MFNNNINKPAITVFFCHWHQQKLVFASGKNYFCRDGFFRGKNRFLPVTGKNLPTLNVPIVSAHFRSLLLGCITKMQRCSLLLQLECDLSMCLSVADTELSPTRKNEVIVDGATCGVVCGLGWARKRIVLVGGYPMERCKTGRTPPTTLQSRGDIWPEWTLQKRMSDQSAICDVDSGGPKSPSGITRNSGAPDKYRSRALPPLYTTCVCVCVRASPRMRVCEPLTFINSSAVLSFPQLVARASGDCPLLLVELTLTPASSSCCTTVSCPM